MTNTITDTHSLLTDAQQISLAAVADRARSMTTAELHYARLDCREAAERLERAGVPVSKDGGFYRDEASVYAAEQARRAA